MNHVRIRRTSEADYNAVAELLKSASLPTEGVVEHFQHFLVAENEIGIVGAISLEVYDDSALLRSAVVHPSLQNKGLGSVLYNHLIENAKSLGVRRLILLTNTAEKYFAKKGFKKIDGKSVSGPITRSVEFTGACPSSAVCMELILNSERSEESKANEILRSSHPSASLRTGLPQNDRLKVLILCTGNSCRSQMAEGWLRHFGEGKIEAFSAGTHPCFVHPLAIQVMQEVGVDISSHRSKSVNEFIGKELDYVVTVCDNAREECPYLPGIHTTIHMPFEDPSFAPGTTEERLNEFRQVRDIIKEEIRGIAAQMGLAAELMVA